MARSERLEASVHVHESTEMVALTGVETLSTQALLEKRMKERESLEENKRLGERAAAHHITTASLARRRC